MPLLHSCRKRGRSFRARILAAAVLLGSPLFAAPLGDLRSPDGWEINLGEEFPGARGTFSVRKDGAMDAGVLAYDFAAGGAYVALTLPGLDVGATHGDIRLKARSDAAQKLSLRLRDATGQFHQAAIPYNRPGEWQPLRVSLAPFRAAFHFGGSNDGVLHFPIQELWLIVDKSDSAKTGEVLFADLQATETAPAVAKPAAATAPAPASNAALTAHPVGDLGSADGWQVNLGEEFAGAKGDFTVRPEGAANVGVVTYDFTAGGQYIAVTASGLEIAADHAEIQIKVKAATPQKLALRLGDATGQFHQVAIPYTKAGTWQTLRATLPPLRAAFRFGGANDGVVHFPIHEVWLIVDKPNGAKAGEILFAEFQTLASAAPSPAAATASTPVVAAAAPEAPAEKADSTSVPLNYRMGVATHFGNGAHYIPIWKIEPGIKAAAELGVGWIRDDFHWKEYEKTKGRYVIPDRSRRWIEAANQAGLKVILILSGGNPIYEDPYDPAAFARAAAAIATELRGKIHAIEILNEPHNSGFAKHYGGTWNGYDAGSKTVQPWVARYVTLLNASAKAIRAVDPQVKILGLGSVPPVNFRQLAMGVAPEVDGITEHPYSIRGVPEIIPYAAKEGILKRDGIATADEQGNYVSLVRMYREQSAKHKGPRELWMTEWGFASYQEAKPSFFAGVTREAQAKYALRRFAEDLGLGVEVSICYALKDDGSEPHNAEHNFGLLTKDNQPKPAYAAVRRLARLMQPYAPISPAPSINIFTGNTRPDTFPITWDGARLAAPDTVRSYAFIHAEHGRPLLLLWSTERAGGDLAPRIADVELPASWSSEKVTSLDLFTGETRVLKPELRGQARWLSGLTIPAHPLALEFQ